MSGPSSQHQGRGSTTRSSKLKPSSTPDLAREICRNVEALIEKTKDSDPPVDAEQWKQALLDCATDQMARSRGVDSPPWSTEASAHPSLRQSVSRWPESIWRDPHALGWLHEQSAAAARHESFADHVHREKKHASSTVTTQLYTPRWIADVLARGALQVADDAAPTVLDPAVGGGQMLLAAMDVLVERAPEAPAAQWVRPLWGVDLDPGAIEAARRGLALEVARRKGVRDERAEAIIDRQLVVADALNDDFEDLHDGRWSVVLTNPPYMGWRSMPASLRQRLDPRFRPYHRDLFSAFIARCHELADGAVGILAQQSIWYLRRFEKARRHLLDRGHLAYFVHLGAGAFWNLDGEKASVAAFVQSTDPDLSRPTRIWDLRNLSGPGEKQRAFEEDLGGLAFDIKSTEAVPGRPLCHDLSGALRRLFADLPPLDEFATVPGGQNKTGRNREFVRAWNDVDPGDLRRVEALGDRGRNDGRWVFYSKGGRFAPWWGNWDWVVDWSEEARRFYRENRNSNLLDERFWFRQGIVYTDFGGKRFNARWMPPGCVFDMTGPAIFPDEKWWPTLTDRQRIGAALAILNSSPARRMLRALNPTLHFQVRNVRALPIPILEKEEASELASHVWTLIEGVRALHHGVESDPLHRPSKRCSDEERRQKLRHLSTLESDIDARVCRAYGVPRNPILRGDITHHHALS